MTFRIHNGAKQDFNAAVEFYETARLGLGKEFSTEIRKSFERIKVNPLSWVRVSENIRKYNVQRFPYSILFTVVDDEIVILAIMHAKRKPDYWGKRIT